MRRDKKQAFTLLELLVVITIIAGLIGILVPAVQMARESARRTQCTNNQKNLAIALIHYEQVKGSFPYWRHFIALEPALPANQGGNVNNVGYRWMKYGRGSRVPMGVFGYGNYTYTGWLPQLFPYIDMQPLYNILKTTIDTTTTEKLRKPTGMKLPTLWCPSNGGQENKASSFVANCGYNDAGWGKRYYGNQYNYTQQGIQFQMPGEFGKADGIFKDGVIISIDGDTCVPPMKLDYITDGLSNTMLITENVQAGNMWTYREDVVGFCWPWKYISSNKAENARPTSATPGAWDYWDFYGDPNKYGCAKLAAGRCYNNDPAYTSSEYSTAPSKNNDGYVIDESRAMAPNMCKGYFDTDRGWTAARPSSYHAGIFNAAFADGSVRAINENLPRTVFIQAMTACDADSVCEEIHGVPFSPGDMFD